MGEYLKYLSCYFERTTLQSPKHFFDFEKRLKEIEIEKKKGFEIYVYLLNNKEYNEIVIKKSQTTLVKEKNKCAKEQTRIIKEYLRKG